MKEEPFWRRYARFFGPNPAADVDDELSFHLETKIDDLVAQGWQPDQARLEAVRQFGNIQEVQQVGEELGQLISRNQRRRDYSGEFLQDLQYTFRILRRDRGFAAITVLILALGIAANTSVFSVVNTVLLRPLPFPEAQQLTWISSDRRIKAELREIAGLSSVTYTVAAFEEFQRHNHSFEAVTSYVPFFGSSEYTMTGRGEPQSVAAVMVASNFFQTLGVRPSLGRLFVAEECQKGGRPAVLLSDAFWRRHFAADPSVVGQAITLGRQSVTIVGVMPSTFDFGSVFAPGVRLDIYVPAVMDDIRNWGNTLSIVGRLRPGVSVAAAQAEADILFPQLRSAHPDWWSDYASTISGLKEFVSGKLRRSLIVLWSAVGLIQLIVCVNLSNLLLGRAAARSKEFAMRTALGAERGRLFRQLFTESLVLATAGAMAGIALAFVLTRYIAHQGSVALPLLDRVTVDGAALGWTLLVTLTTALVFGFVPGLKLSAGNIQNTLKNSGPGVSGARLHDRLRTFMVISEVALACVLLIGAGLLLRSFLKVMDVDLGFQPSRAAVIKVDYDDGNNLAKRASILQEMLRNVQAIPGVEGAGIADMLPLGRNRSWGFSAQGKVYPKGTFLAGLVRIATPGYLGAMGMKLRSGRDFSWQDSATSEKAVIINESAARRFWQGDDPLGRFARVNGQATRVIGIIADVRQHSLEKAAEPEFYLPVTQADPEGAELVIRTKLPPESLFLSVMQTLRRLNPAQPAAEFQPLEQIVDHAVSPRRFFVLLVTSFAGLGLVLAALGIYGVISYTVTQQTQEIGIRMALGATAGRVQLGVVSKALRLASFGILLGTVASLVAAKWIATLLYGTQPTDPLTFAGIGLLLGLVALVAGFIPARRASQIDPMIALRGN